VTQRPIYIAFNQMRLSLGNPIFGPISFVFSPAVVRNMTFVAPVDTGIWEMSCNHTGGGARSHHHGWPTNCSGWNGEVNASTAAFVHAPLGTMQHHTHVWLQNTRFWNLTDDEGLALLFGRLFAPSETNLTGMAQNFCECNARTPTLHSCSIHSILVLHFLVSENDREWLRSCATDMEANLAGSPPLPEGVHAIIANFDQLFGTATGLELQQWCANSSWVLLWALDPTGGADHHAPGSTSMIRRSAWLTRPCCHTVART
jgi:hypothetical protein